MRGWKAVRLIDWEAERLTVKKRDCRDERV